MRRLHYAWVVAGLTFLVLAISAGMRGAPGVLLVAVARAPRMLPRARLS